MDRGTRSIRGAGTSAARGWLIAALAFVVAVGAVACATTQFKSTWKDPTAQPIALQGQKVAAFLITPNESMRRSGEDILSRELSARGVQGIPGYQLTGDKPSQDSEVLRKKLGEMGVDGAVILRVVDRRQEVNYVPGSPYYGSMYGYWDYGWAMTASPGYLQTDTIVSVETLVYSARDEKLLWGGVSETIDPRNLDKFIKEIVKAAGDEMKKAGLVTA
jgi:hypothetical protein